MSLRRVLVSASLFVLLVGVAFPVFAASVVVLQGSDSPFDRRYFSGFSSSFGERITAYPYDEKKIRSLLSKIKKQAPDLIFTVGPVDLRQFADLLPSTPIIASREYAGGAAQRANVVLIESRNAVEPGLKLAQALFPERKTVGTIYNPALSQDRFDILVKKAADLGLKIASIKVASPQDVQSFVNAFSGKADLIYWLPDATTAHADSIAAIFQFAEANNLPVITTDPGHLELGALLALAVDPFMLGEKAWDTAHMILEEGKIPQMTVEISPKEFELSVSIGAAAKFGLGADRFYGFLQKALKEGYRLRVDP